MWHNLRDFFYNFTVFKSSCKNFQTIKLQNIGPIGSFWYSISGRLWCALEGTRREPQTLGVKRNHRRRHTWTSLMHIASIGLHVTCARTGISRSGMTCHQDNFLLMLGVTIAANISWGRQQMVSVHKRPQVLASGDNLSSDGNKLNGALTVSLV